MKPAIILLSGGLDSTTCLAIAKSRHYALYALTFRYGQRHEFEIKAAQVLARQYGVEEHIITRIDLRSFGGSALTDDIDVPKDQSQDETGIPITYVPARNTIFLSFALAWAEVLPAADIFIGVNAIDYSGYPDCRPEFIRAFEKLAHYATRMGTEDHHPITIHTPLITMTKAEIIQTGLNLGVDYSLTHSCYDPDAQGRPCGHCDACRLRRKGFQEAGIPDPLPYPS